MPLLRGRDLLSLSDLSADELAGLLDLAADLKAGHSSPLFPNKVLGLRTPFSRYDRVAVRRTSS